MVSVVAGQLFSIDSSFKDKLSNAILKNGLANIIVEKFIFLTFLRISIVDNIMSIRIFLLYY